MKTTLLVLSVALATATNARACGNYATLRDASLLASLDCDGQIRLSLDDLTRDAVGTDKTKAENAIRALRARGPEGLRALMDAHVARQNQPITANPFVASIQPDESWLRLKAALDAVSGQRDCHASQLYWYTDFEQAKAAAKAQAKPILSLRLLGRLDEEFSCANSRFFRTTLYANAEVSQYIRDHFILHWKSVRPVPRVTIDFGDGRKLERTITGNSIHYVLNPDGEVVDALPGLYGAKAFVRGLKRAEEISQRSSKADDAERKQLLTAYHQSRIIALDVELDQDLQKIATLPAASGLLSPLEVTYAIFSPPSARAAELLTASKLYVETPISRQITPLPATTPPSGVTLNTVSTPPTARTAGQIAKGKGRVENPILDRTLPGPASPLPKRDAGLDDATWQQIARLHADDATLDAAARSLVLAKGPNAIEAGRVAISKTFVEDPLIRKMRSMERSISEDTVRNEYLLHRQIHEWLAGDAVPKEIDQLNAKVYAELFLTPDSDPWLGLVPADAYTALDNDGLTLTAKRSHGQ